MTKFQIEFRITGTKISVDELTSLIGISPSRVWHLGDIIQGTKLKRKHNGWCISLDHFDPVAEIDEGMLLLINMLLPKSKLIAQICKEYDLECEMSTVIKLTDRVPAINLSKEIIQGLADLKASIDIDIIFSQK